MHVISNILTPNWDESVSYNLQKGNVMEQSHTNATEVGSEPASVEPSTSSGSGDSDRTYNQSAIDVDVDYVVVRCID